MRSGYSLLLSILLLLPITLSAQTSGGGFSVDLQQAPQLQNPVAASVSGRVEAWMAGDPSARGSFSYTLPLKFDDSRAPLLISLAPTWAPGQGLSPWGLGWNQNLSIKRVNIFHEIDFSTDYLQSPWGLLVQALDGFWYPQGLTSRVQVEYKKNSLTARFPHGTKMHFAALSADDEDLEWNLVRATDIRGFVNILEYGESGVNQKYLSTVSWGLSESDLSARVKFVYAPLALNRYWTSYRLGGHAKTLDRLVKTVEFYQLDSQQEKLRWSYAIDHIQNSFGPGFSLSSLQQSFPSGEKKPALQMVWGDLKSHLDETQPTSSNRLKPILDKIGFTRLQSQHVSVTDFNHDGYADIEVGQDNSIFFQNAEGFGGSVARPMPNNRRAECRSSAQPGNNARNLMPLEGYLADDLVVYSKAATAGTSRLVICSQDGQQLQELTLGGEFAPDSRVKIVDLNHDGRPDLVRILRGSYLIAQNESKGQVFSFAEKVSRPLDVEFNPSATEPYFSTDMNGDGLTDLVMVRSGSLLVAYGKGHMVFGPEVSVVRVFDRLDKVFYFQGFELKPLDANRDGLTDFLAIKGSKYALLLNDGQGLLEYDLSRLQQKITFSKYLYADLLGDGIPQLIQAGPGGLVKALALTSPDTAMLLAINDGLGNTYRLKWAPGPPTPHVGERPLILRSMTLNSTGEVERTVSFEPGYPQVNSQTPIFLGFAHMTALEGPVKRIYQFFNNDEVQGLVQQKIVVDSNRPDISHNTSLHYQRSDFRGLGIQRMMSQESGFSKTGESTLVSQVQNWSQFDANECPQTISMNAGSTQKKLNISYATPSDEIFPLSCMQQSVELSPISNPSSGENLHWSYERNAFGQVTQVSQRSLTAKTILQILKYDDLHRLIEHQTAAGKLIQLSYSGRTLLLDSLLDESGVIRKIPAYSFVGDLPKNIQVINDAGKFQQQFTWDGQERLTSVLNDLYPSTNDLAHQRFSYRLSSAGNLGVVKESRLNSAGESVELFEISSSIGEVLAKASPSDDGYVYNARLFKSEGGRRSESHRPLSSPVNPLLAGIADLKADDPAITQELSDGFGMSLLRENIYEVGVKGSLTHTLKIEQDLLHHTEFTNSSLSKDIWVDGAGLIKRIRLEKGSNYEFDYDWNGRLKRVVLPSGKSSEISYDAMGRKSQVKRSGMGTMTVSYDDRTNLPLRKDYTNQLGNPVRSEGYSYDSKGRLFEVKHTDGKSILFFRQRYDGENDGNRLPNQKGFLSFEEGSNYQRTLTYSLDGRLISRKTLFDRVWELNEGADYAWDGSVTARRISYLNTQSGFKQSYTLRYAQDKLGRLSQVTLDGNLLASLSYNELNQIEAIQDSQGRVRKPIYDSQTADAMGWSESDRGFNWHFDERGLMASETFSAGSQSIAKLFSFDANGYLSQETSSAASIGYTYNTDGQRATTDIFDDSGRRKFANSFSLSYGADGQLESAVNPGALIRYAYDASQQRIMKFRNGDIDAAFAENIILKKDRIAEVILLNGQVYGLLDNGKFKTIAADHSGTPFVQENGSLAPSSAFGESSWKAEQEILAFAKEGRDIDTGLVRFGVRDYDSKAGLFTTADPLLFENPEHCIESPTECNLYSYARNNPLQFTDPTGKLAWFLLFGAALASDFVFNPAPVNAPGAEGEIDTSMPPETKLGLAVAATSLARSTLSAFGRLPAGVKAFLSKPFLPGKETGAISLGGESSGIAQAAKISNNALADEIASGHAFGKHVIKRKEFPGITTQQQFADRIKAFLNSPATVTRELVNGRKAYWNDEFGDILIKNPIGKDSSTFFKPTLGRKYFEEVP